MSGVIFLKLIYLFQQKKCKKIEFYENQSLFDLCLNDIQIYKNRFYSTFLAYISLNRSDRNENMKKKKTTTFRQCLVLQVSNQDQIDMSEIMTRLNSYCSMEYQINGRNQVYLFLQSEHCQRQILKDYFNDPLYKIEKFNWFKHSLLMQYSIGIAIIMTGMGICLLVKRRL